jgi:MHS family shikimate/dehydroshikimate transporter-like MFS transporter
MSGAHSGQVRQGSGRHRSGERAAMRRIAAASLVGTSIEWYDFFLFATMAALVFNRVFFPSLDPAAGTLASFATFGAGFVARPIGGLLMGHFGDRVGRKSALVTSLTLMGLATFAIGLIPTYDRIGIAAPAILTALRFIQGFALGGEWGGAAALAVEHAPARRRGYWSAWVQYGAIGGIMLSTGTVLLLSATLSQRQFLTWGWRIPFLASGILLVVGLFVRLRIEESPVFRTLTRDGGRARVPAVGAVRDHGLTIVRVTGLHLVVAAFATTTVTFVVAYGVTKGGYTRSDMLQVLFLATAITGAVAPWLGHLSDVIGRRRLYVIGCALAMAGTFPSFLLLDTGRIGPGIAGVLCLALPTAVVYQTQGAYFPELFPPRFRVSGAGLGVQLATVAVGGPAPIIAQSLLRSAHGRPWAVSTYLCGIAFVSLVFALLTPDKRPARTGVADAQLERWDAARAAAHRAPAAEPAREKELAPHP